MWGDMSHYGWWWGLGWVHMLLFWILLVLLIAALAKWVFGGPAWRDRRLEKSTLDILKERYARGEINREEYEQKKRDLET